MKFAATATVSAALLSISSVASAAILATRSCPQALRFGRLSVSPSTVSPGDTLTISVDLTCAVQDFGIVPEFLDYTLEVPAASNNGFEPPIVLARRALPAGALTDSFTVQVPHAFYTAGAPYNIILTDIYSIEGTDGSPVTVKGGVLSPITINA